MKIFLKAFSLSDQLIHDQVLNFIAMYLLP